MNIYFKKEEEGLLNDTYTLSSTAIVEVVDKQINSYCKIFKLLCASTVYIYTYNIYYNDFLK